MSSATGRTSRLPKSLVVAVAAVLLLSMTAVGAFALRSAEGAQEIVIGAMATGDDAAGQDAFRGLDLAVAETGLTISGKSIRVIKVATDGTPDDALAKAKRLVEQDGVDVVIGPMSGAEGLRVKEYARSVPETTFISSSDAQDVTLRNPAPNVFRFSPDSAQWQAGLGAYAYNDLGYRYVAVVADDAAYPYAQVGGFMSEFCTAGGHVVQKLWVPVDVTDFAETVSQIPVDVDAIYLALDGADAVGFLTAYVNAGGTAQIIAGTTTIDPTLLASPGALRDRLVGIPSASPIAASADNPAWAEFVADYETAYPDAGQPSVSAFTYYTSTKAAMLALEQVGGDLGDGQARLMTALAGLTFYTPTGAVRLDHNRQAIADNFVTVVDVDSDGALYAKLVRVVPNVNQTLGLPETKFLAQGQFGRDNPSCP
jgi:branched-chain amino acid transport system substrate-binding protein